MSLEPEVLEHLRQAVTEADSWHAVDAKLRELAPQDTQEQYRPFVLAFGYMLVHDEERRSEEGPFAPMIVTDHGQFPPPLADVVTAYIDAWIAAAGAIDDPIATSRLEDLLWERSTGERPDLHARAAVDAYVELSANPDWPAIERLVGLVRALELALIVRDEDRMGQVVRRSVEMVREDLAAEDGGPGVALGLLAPLARLESPPDDLDELIDATEARYGDDPYIAETIVELKIGRAPERRKDLRREQVNRWRTAAGETEGMIRAIHLQHALELATRHELEASLIEELRRELQAMNPEDFDLKTVSAEVEIPTEAIRQMVDRIVGDDDLEGALTRFGVAGPPGGEPENLDERIEDLRQAAPLQFLVTQVVMSSDESSVLFLANTDERRQQWVRAQQRANAARLWSLLAADVLDEIREAHSGSGSREAIRELFTTTLIRPEIADRIAHGFERYWGSEPDDAAHVIAPRIEAILRELARHLGIPTYLEPSGASPGRERPIGWILEQLRPVFARRARGWHAYLVNLLADSLGLNLRNVIAHGLRDEIDRGDAALLLQTACYLRLLKVERRE